MQIAVAMTRYGTKSEPLGKIAAVERECERIGIPLALEGKTQFVGGELAILLKQARECARPAPDQGDSRASDREARKALETAA